MAWYSEGLVSGYNYLMNEAADVRVKDWPLMSTPWPVVGLLVGYLYFVLSFGPRYMRHRKPYDLKGIIALYNVGQVVSCVFLFYHVLTSGWTTRYTLGCQPVDYSEDELAIKMAGLVWWTMILKITELIETIFFVLRKKDNQVSFLHLYHHTSTLSLGWMGTKFVAELFEQFGNHYLIVCLGGMATFPIMPNSLVHILMYTYYLLALLGPNMQKRLNKWKRYLTILQMVQFCILVGHSFQALSPNCDVPKFLAYIYIPNVFLVFYLFYDFYTKTYMNKSTKKA